MMKSLKYGFAAGALAFSGTLAGCQVNPATGRMQFVPMPSGQVAQLGNEAKPELVEEYGGEVPIPELRRYVEQVGQSLAEHVESEFADISWTFTVLDSDVINAFALPGGHVFISRGLLAEFNNEAQLAGVLGHEIGHVTGRHVDERIGQAMGWELGLGLLGQLTESQIALAVGQLFAGGYQLSFGRDQEQEADELGVRYMAAAGYDPRGMLQVLDVLQRAAEGRHPPEFLSTHPHPETRIRTVTRLLASEYAHTQDNPEYRLHEERFQQQARPHLRAAAGRGSHPAALALMAMAPKCSCCAH